jgi:hypothetical protein
MLPTGRDRKDIGKASPNGGGGMVGVQIALIQARDKETMYGVR